MAGGDAVVGNGEGIAVDVAFWVKCSVDWQMTGSNQICRMLGNVIAVKQIALSDVTVFIDGDFGVGVWTAISEHVVDFTSAVDNSSDQGQRLRLILFQWPGFTTTQGDSRRDMSVVVKSDATDVSRSGIGVT